MQNELIRLQSFTDPLTEIYNRRSLEELAAVHRPGDAHGNPAHLPAD